MKKTAIFLLIISIIFVFTACGTEKGPEIVLAEQTEYVRPQCREVINDDELINTVSNLKDNGEHVYIGEGGQLQSPVCIILYDIGEDEYSFLTTKLFDTVNNPAEARTILLVNAKWWNFQHEKK